MNQGVRIIATFEDRAIPLSAPDRTSHTGKVARSINEGIQLVAGFESSAQPLTKRGPELAARPSVEELQGIIEHLQQQNADLKDELAAKDQVIARYPSASPDPPGIKAVSDRLAMLDWLEARLVAPVVKTDLRQLMLLLSCMSFTVLVAYLARWVAGPPGFKIGIAVGAIILACWYGLFFRWRSRQPPKEEVLSADAPTERVGQ